MANTVIISSITPQGGDSILVVGTVNGSPVTVNVSRAVIGSFATAILANNYIAYIMLHNAPQGISQGAVQATPGTVNL